MNLENFLSHYKHSNKCIIAPTSFPNLQPDPQDINKYSIEIRNLVIKYAWEIGENDMDISALPNDPDPYIPDNEKNPPILKAIKTLKDLKRK